MLVFHQSNRARAIKQYVFLLSPRIYCIFVFFHVYVSSLLLPYMLKSIALRVEAETLYTMQRLSTETCCISAMSDGSLEAICRSVHVEGRNSDLP